MNVRKTVAREKLARDKRLRRALSMMKRGSIVPTLHNPRIATRTLTNSKLQIKAIFGNTHHFLRYLHDESLMQSIDTCEIYDQHMWWLKRHWDNPNALLIVATESIGNSKPTTVGAASCLVRRNSIYIDYMCSARRGTGRAMMKFIEEEALFLQKQHIELVSMEDAIPFYEKLGFVRGPIGNTVQKRTKAELDMIMYGAANLKNDRRYFNGVYYKSDLDEILQTLPKYHKNAIAASRRVLMKRSS